MAEVVCGRCGHGNPFGGNFCSSCGSPLDQWTDERTSTFLTPVGVGATEDSATDEAASQGGEPAMELGDLPTGSAVLVVRRGPGAGSRFLLDQGIVTAGRHPDSHIFLDDVTVSRRHAEIVRAGSAFHVRDVDSLNGTYVNRARIDGEVVLHDGDELQIGRFKLVFLVAP